MLYVDKEILLDELKAMAQKMFGDLVKAVVDVEKEVMVVDADMHADQEHFLLERGSQQQNLWGINLHPNIDRSDEGWVEFDSMINLRPSWGNKSRGVDNPELQQKIREIVKKLVK